MGKKMASIAYTCDGDSNGKSMDNQMGTWIMRVVGTGGSKELLLLDPAKASD